MGNILSNERDPATAIISAPPVARDEPQNARSTSKQSTTSASTASRATRLDGEEEAGTRNQMPGLASPQQVLADLLAEGGPRLAVREDAADARPDLGKAVNHLSPFVGRDTTSDAGPGEDSPLFMMHHIFVLMRSPTVGPHGYVEGLRPYFVCDIRPNAPLSQSNGLFTLNAATMGEARQYISEGIGGLAKDWSLSLQLRHAAPEVAPIMASDGSVVWVVTVPRNPTVGTTSYPALAGYLAVELPGALPAVRAAVVAGASLPPPVWEDDAFARDAGLSPPPKLGKWLADETDKARSQVAQQLQDLHILWDDTGYSIPSVYALPNKRAVASMVRWVGEAVNNNSLDEPSIRLFCSLLRRHDRYVPTFGDIPPELLTLEYGPSQRMPQSECLSAVYYPTRDDRINRRPIRMDVGADSTFSTSLRSPTDSTPGANLKRRLHDAIREDTRLHRSQSIKTSPAHCAHCLTGLANLQAAQGLPVTSTVNGEFHHVVTVAELCQRHCDGLAAPEALLQPPPNHHLFRPSSTRDDIRRALSEPGATAWLCPSCHALETANHNREVAAARARVSSVYLRGRRLGAYRRDRSLNDGDALTRRPAKRARLWLMSEAAVDLPT
jgi:hypothetical protein